MHIVPAVFSCFPHLVDIWMNFENNSHGYSSVKFAFLRFNEDVSVRVIAHNFHIFLRGRIIYRYYHLF